MIRLSMEFQELSVLKLVVCVFLLVRNCVLQLYKTKLLFLYIIDNLKELCGSQANLYCLCQLCEFVVCVIFGSRSSCGWWWCWYFSYILLTLPGPCWLWPMVMVRNDYVRWVTLKQTIAGCAMVNRSPLLFNGCCKLWLTVTPGTCSIALKCQSLGHHSGPPDFSLWYPASWRCN